MKEVDLLGQVAISAKKFPLAYSPKTAIDYIQLQRYFSQNSNKIVEQVTQEGAVYFRGCGVRSASEFSGVLSQLGVSSFEYVGGAAVRTLIIGSQTSKTNGIEIFTTN